MDKELIAFIGVIVGGVLSFLFSYILDVIRSKREEQNRLKHKREEAYLKVNQLIYDMHHLIKAHPTEDEANKISEIIRGKREKIHPELILYASRKVRNKFLDIICVPDQIKDYVGNADDNSLSDLRLKYYNKFIHKDSEDFLDIIRKELGIYEDDRNVSPFNIQCNLCHSVKSFLTK